MNASKASETKKTVILSFFEGGGEEGLFSSKNDQWCLLQNILNLSGLQICDSTVI